MILNVRYEECLKMLVNLIAAMDVNWGMLIQDLAEINKVCNSMNRLLSDIKNIYLDDQGITNVVLKDGTKFTV